MYLIIHHQMQDYHRTSFCLLSFFVFCVFCVTLDVAAGRYLLPDPIIKTVKVCSCPLLCHPQGNTIPGVLKFHGLITTFEMIMADCPELKKLHWRCVVIDEAHRLKNRNCKLLEGLKLMNLVRLSASLFVRYNMILSAELYNRHGEMESVIFFLTGTQSSADGNTAPKLCGGVVQFVELLGAAAVSLRKYLSGRVWRPQDR